MPKFDFIMTLPANQEKLFTIATDYKKFQRFFPQQIKHINIVESNKNEIITEETLFFSTIIKKDILQRTIHKKLSENTLESRVITGPFKNSTLVVSFDKIDVGTRISVNMDLRIDLKYRILSPIIKKRYRTVLTAFFYKINTLALE